MTPSAPDEPSGSPPPPEPDFYMEGPYRVMTAAFLLRRGYCCESGCRHCPYAFGGPRPRASASPNPPANVDKPSAKGL